MSFNDKLWRQFRHRVADTATQWERSTRDSSDVELVLGSLLGSPGLLSSIHFPVQFVEFMRGCIEDRCPCTLRVLKTTSQAADIAAKRFDTLKEQLLQSLPPIDFSIACDLAFIADRNRCLSEPVEFNEWAGDLGLHFSLSSSYGGKGRLLFNIIRIMRSQRCLELGTAYGMSALFILAALKMYVPSGSLATLEGFKLLMPVNSAILKERYGDMVSCHFGNASAVLPELTKSLKQIDFLFHDCGHSRTDYLNDFNNIVEILAPGSVVLFDDIRWEDPRNPAANFDTYGGWTAVASHPRVRQALEIDDSLGLLLIA